MSRYYRIFVIVKHKDMIEEELSEIMREEFNWEEMSTCDNKDETVEFTGEGSLCGGQSEFEAHEQVSKFIKEKYEGALVRTEFTYLEEIPYETYGDDFE